MKINWFEQKRIELNTDHEMGEIDRGPGGVSSASNQREYDDPCEDEYENVGRPHVGILKT